VLAPVLARLGRYDDAVRAYRNAIAYAGDSAERRSDLGEALAGAAGGVVTAEAKAEFERAVAQNAEEPKANYFLGLAAEQDGAGARRERAGQHVDERRLAGAVRADQRMDVALRDIHVELVQRVEAAEAFGQAFDRKTNVVGGGPTHDGASSAAAAGGATCRG